MIVIGVDVHKHSLAAVAGSQGRPFSLPLFTSSRRSRTPALANAAVRSASCSARGAADAQVRSRWAPGTGAWCIGCCWALMASLFALGVMSVVWMAVVAGLIAFEKLFPARRVATYGTVAILLVLGGLMLAAPDTIPALTIPGDSSMSRMDQMNP
jgi:hypothetical protein